MKRQTSMNTPKKSGEPVRNPTFSRLAGLALMAAVVGTSFAQAQTREAAPLRFSGACTPGDTMVISAVGDVLLHGPLQQYSWRSGQSFYAIWGGMTQHFQRADVAYANLEGPIAPGVTRGGRRVPDVNRFDNNIYTGFPLFNFPQEAATSLRRAGIDIVSTANNHTLDRGSIGADLTLQNVRSAGLIPFGSWEAGAAEELSITHRAGGFNLAWISCTFSYNGLIDRRNQVLHCYNDEAKIMAEIRRRAAQSDVDGVIVTPHWGNEYQLRHAAREQRLGRAMIQAGALAVIGTHPHVVQPWEKVTTADGREGFIIYSTGNFASNQLVFPKNLGLMVYLTLGRNGGKAFVRGASYIPLMMERFTERGAAAYRVRPVIGGEEQAPARAWSIVFGNYSRENRFVAGEDPRTKPCARR